MTEHRQCLGVKPDGTACRRRPDRGGLYCRFHDPLEASRRKHRETAQRAGKEADAKRVIEEAVQTDFRRFRLFVLGLEPGVRVLWTNPHVAVGEGLLSVVWDKDGVPSVRIEELRRYGKGPRLHPTTPVRRTPIEPDWAEWDGPSRHREG